MNRLKTFVLLATLTALLLWAGKALGGTGGLWFALILAGAMNFGAYWFADRIVLRMHHAKELTPAEGPELYSMVRELSLRAGIPMPRLYLIPEATPNAFATGRNPEKGVVAVTQGLVQALDRSEIAGVIAHELAHIKHRDTLVMSIAATLAGAMSMLANAAMFGSLLGGHSSDEGDESAGPMAGLLGVLIAPLAATLVQLSISRAREYMADAAAARYTGRPLALAGALRKIEEWNHELPMHTGSPAMAHMYISNPFRGGLASLFSTHPPTGKRIARLEAIATGTLHAVA